MPPYCEIEYVDITGNHNEISLLVVYSIRHAVEQRAQQQQQIESRRQQHFENQQRQTNGDRGGSQRVERSAPAQREQPQATQRNGNADDGSVRRR